VSSQPAAATAKSHGGGALLIHGGGRGLDGIGSWTATLTQGSHDDQRRNSLQELLEKSSDASLSAARDNPASRRSATDQRCTDVVWIAFTAIASQRPT
jgi:hypothetical protein